MGVSHGFTRTADGEGDSVQYTVIFTWHQDAFLNGYGSFGLQCTTRDSRILWQMTDLCLRRQPVCRLARLLNRLQPSLLHLEDIVEDFVGMW